MSSPAKRFTFDSLKDELSSVLIDKRIALERMTVYECYLLMQSCQLTTTHPGLSEYLRSHYRTLGRRLQEAIRPMVSDHFAAFCEDGWKR